jgi:hypothetical protein
MAQSLRDMLSMIDRHIAASERNIAQQRHHVSLAERSGGVSTLSRSILNNFEQALRLHHEHREMVLRDLERGPAAHHPPLC